MKEGFGTSALFERLVGSVYLTSSRGYSDDQRHGARGGGLTTLDS